MSEVELEGRGRESRKETTGMGKTSYKTGLGLDVRCMVYAFGKDNVLGS